MINHLNNLVAQGKIKEVLEELKSLFQNSKKINEVILQSAKYNEVRKQIRNGTLNYETASISKSKINVAILEIITELDEAIENQKISETDLSKSQSKIQTTINQKHSGEGHNIGGDFTINN